MDYLGTKFAFNKKFPKDFMKLMDYLGTNT